MEHPIKILKASLSVNEKLYEKTKAKSFADKIAELKKAIQILEKKPLIDRLKSLLRLSIIILGTMLIDSCCIYQDIQETIADPKAEVNETYYVEIIDYYKPNDRIRKGDVYLNLQKQSK